VIYRTSRFRLVARVFAVLLLAWTSADLCGPGFCLHDREPIAPWSSRAPGTPAAVNAAGPAQADAATVDGPDDCFCCCHCIDVRVRFQLPVGCSFASMVSPGHSSAPVSISSLLDHPPSA
jgi:hypothetical protein